MAAPIDSEDQKACGIAQSTAPLLGKAGITTQARFTVQRVCLLVTIYSNSSIHLPVRLCELGDL